MTQVASDSIDAILACNVYVFKLLRMRTDIVLGIYGGSRRKLENPSGARGGNRTRTLFRATDFKSVLATSYNTRAGHKLLEARTRIALVYRVLQTLA